MRIVRFSWVISSGIESLKLYYMIGLPTEDDADLVAIRDLTMQLHAIMLKHARARGRIGRIVASVNPLVPKPGTAYQWLPMAPADEIERKMKRMRALVADIVGPICESGDCFAKERELQEVGEGELIAFMSAGAYGYTMASRYNTRGMAAEVLVKGSEINFSGRVASAFRVIREKTRILKNKKIDRVLEFKVDESILEERITGRWIHAASGRSYHTKFNPPKVEGKDDVTGEPLIQRDDDKEETVRKRLDVYSSQTRPLVDYYSQWAKSEPHGAPQYRAISGLGTVEEIKERAFNVLK